MIDRIDDALDMASVVVQDVSQDQLGLASLCDGWNVRDELNHLVGGMRIFSAELDGIDAGADHHADWLGDDHHAAFITAADLDRAAWHRPGSLGITVKLSFGPVPGPMAAVIHLSELVIHTVDLALVTGQENHIDQHQCERLLADMRAMEFDAFRRPGMFGPEVASRESAPAHRRLLAFVGRSVS